MTVPLSAYSNRFREAVASVVSGRRGSISDNYFLIGNYGQGCYEILLPGLEHEDYRVRKETVLLFARLRIVKARDIITEMGYREREPVAGACVAYLKAIEDAEERVPELLYIANHRNGGEFRTAMRTLGELATEKDIPEIRKIMGQVSGEMREQTRTALSRIIDRDPDLERKRPFILSNPVYPDEVAYRTFLDKSIDYLDVRYKKNVLPRREVKLAVYNNVASALLKMQIRIYNERPNLVYYEKGIAVDTERLEELIYWAADDMKSKDIVRPEELGRVSNIGDYS